MRFYIFINISNTLNSSNIPITQNFPTGTDKLPLHVIGTARSPRCFRNKAQNFPFDYDSSKNAWMVSRIFHSYLFKWNEILKKKGRKICLVVDNCSAHPKDAIGKYENINLRFLRPNITSLVQPMDAGVIAKLKNDYRNNFVEWLLDECDKLGKDDKLPTIDLFDSMKMLSQVWERIPGETLKKCFAKAKWYNEYTLDETEELEVREDFVNLDDELCRQLEIDDFDDEVIVDEQLQIEILAANIITETISSDCFSEVSNSSSNPSHDSFQDYENTEFLDENVFY